MNRTEDFQKYAAILERPHVQSATRPHMSMQERAAQFSPFATVKGHGEAVLETQRLTENWVPPSEEEQARLNEKTARLLSVIRERPAVSICYFEPDAKKEGGRYVRVEGRLRRIDTAEGMFVLEDDTRIPMPLIVQIESERFETNLQDL